MSKCRQSVLLCAAVGAFAFAGAASATLPFALDPEAQPQTVGSPQDPQERLAAMGALQKTLAASQVSQALAREVVVPLSAAERKQIDVPGRAQGRYMVGLTKPLGIKVGFDAIGKGLRNLTAGAARGDDGGFVWTSSFRSPGATALRVNITGLDLPAGAELYVYNLAGMAYGPYTGRGPNGNGVLYTQSIFSEQVLLQLSAPAGVRVPALRIEGVGVIGKRFVLPSYGPTGSFPLDNLGALATAKAFCADNASCVVNAACTSSNAVNTAKDAVATMLFGTGSLFICTGGVLATTPASGIPYFLTANHCISTNNVASSLEVWFDYTTTCSNPDCTEPYFTKPSDATGATLLSHNSSSDYSFMQLSSTPATPDGVLSYLGWTATAVANTNGTQLYRISHPKGAPQAYSEQQVSTSATTCGTLPRGRFIYSRDNLGATEGGSSGSPVVNGSGLVVGQLYGACGFNLDDVCDSASNATVDGAFANTFPSISSWLNPGGGGGCGAKGSTCTSDSQCCSNRCSGKPGAQSCK
jgi:lysyl endopeptidase